MISDLYPPPSEFLWRELYRAALFESDPYKVQEHIARAEWAIVLRGRQLFGADDKHSRREAQELDDALYTLQALKGCLFERAPASLISEVA